MGNNVDDRTSVWSIGFGLGLSVCGGLLLAAVLRHLAWEWTWLPIGLSVFVMCWFGLPAAVWMVGAGWEVYKTVHAWRHPPQPQAPPPPPAPAALIIRQVPWSDRGKPPIAVEMGTVKSSRWAGWQRGAERWVEWYKRLNSTTSGAMVGAHRAFGSNTEWGAFTDELRRVYLVNKANGKRAVLARSLADVEATILSGEIEWSERLDAPIVAEPPALPAHIPMTVEGIVA